jgi:hypothetical protein
MIESTTKRKTSIFSTPIDSYLCTEDILLQSQKNYEFNDEDSHITDLVKSFCETEEFISESESDSTLDKTKSLDVSALAEESIKANAASKLKISALFKNNLKEDIFEFKRSLMENFSISLKLNCNTDLTKISSVTNKKWTRVFQKSSIFRNDVNTSNIVN